MPRSRIGLDVLHLVHQIVGGDGSDLCEGGEGSDSHACGEGEAGDDTHQLQNRRKTKT